VNVRTSTFSLPACTALRLTLHCVQGFGSGQAL
jgi:hypothetical protein